LTGKAPYKFESGSLQQRVSELSVPEHHGVRPDGANYFPVFPYTSFTGITDKDALAIKAYLFSRPPVRQGNRPHDVAFPFSWRLVQSGWKWLFFTPGPFQPALPVSPPTAALPAPRSSASRSRRKS
jgi:hypothetical protein